MNFYSEECMGYIKERDEWKARALKAEAAISDVVERSTADMMYWKDECLKAEAALREWSETAARVADDREAWKARAFKAEAECTEQRHRAQDAESALLKAEAALREIIGLYVGSNPEMARARDIARAALLQDKEE